MKKKSKPKKPLPKKAMKKAPAKVETPKAKAPEEPKGPAAPEAKAPEKNESAVPTFPEGIDLKNLLLFEGRFKPFQVGERVFKHILDFMCGRWFWDEDLYGSYVPEELRKGYVLLSRGWGSSPTERWREHLSKTAVERATTRRSDGSLPAWTMDSLKVMTIEQFKEWFNKMLDLK